MSVTVRLCPEVSGRSAPVDAVVDADTVKGALEALERQVPGVRSRICEPSGNLRRFVQIYADAADIRFLDHLGTRLEDGMTLSIARARRLG